ncbi:MAG TPA: hypothetical protein VMJ32_13630 [Pirellulales bacterium]|nr:hypothetical protein [Pirellulales bacterium]
MTSRAGFTTAFTSAICWLTIGLPLTAQTTPPQATTSPHSTNSAPQQPQAMPLAPPSGFLLSPGDEANLNKLLTDWENANTNIRTFKCTFTRWEYDPAIVGGNPNQPVALSKGELKYAAPDKGMFKVEEQTNYVPDPKTGQFVEQKVKPTEWWTCNGKSMFEVTVRDNQTLVVEKPLPPEMQGKAITEGPLPFVFGARAETLKTRYYLRMITPAAAAKTDVWLEAYPKLQKDAANFSHVTLILSKADLQPTAIQIFNPGANTQNPARTVIQLENPSINNPWAPLENLFDDFARPNPLGAKHVLEQNAIPPPATTQLPAGNTTDNSQASRGKPPAR